MAAKSGKEMKARKKRKIILFGVELVVIIVMIIALYFVTRMTDTTTNEGPVYVDTKELEEEPEKVHIAPEVVQQSKEEGGTMQGYLNIALFGIDALSTSTNDLLKGYRSDCIMIASINMDNGEIKLVSVYRDTYLNLSNDKYTKCNSAYAKGGATQAISMLNSNLDMDITNWVTVSYKALREVIDGLGGVYIDVDSEEIKHINNYQYSICESLGIPTNSYKSVTSTGYQLLNGLQAAAYCRIRYTAGDDFKRTERQREVLKAIQDQAKQADLNTLTKVFNEAVGDVYTSLDTETLMSLLSNITKYTIVDEGGFPEASMRATGTIGASGSCVIPVDLESNVIWLHKFLFGDENYNPSSNVKDYGAKIKSDTSKYLK